jgi:hypothetical protein
VHGPVDTLPSPRNTLHFVVLGQARPPQAKKELAAQCINNGGKDLSGSHRLPAAARLATILTPFWPGKGGDQRFDFAPKRIRNCHDFVAESYQLFTDKD